MSLLSVEPVRVSNDPARVGLRARRWELWAAWVSIVAGGIHAGAAPSHFAEWWGYGLFFVFISAFQVIFGLGILTNAINEENWGPTWLDARHRVFGIGILINVVSIVLWAITRTIGIPVFGPEAGVVEPVGVDDSVTKALEVVLVVLLLLVRSRIKT